jgi:hypothetical protein
MIDDGNSDNLDEAAPNAETDVTTSMGALLSVRNRANSIPNDDSIVIDAPAVRRPAP